MTQDRALVILSTARRLNRRRSAQRTLRTLVSSRVRCADQAPLAGETIEAQDSEPATDIQ
ncbi:hypothetical protein D779_0681 [Imhoffiella purpurea]|uniref:Uncharacterized protein n=1 Tax=Imhoffiella purpurea TaxID=1249627 RepID=W9VJ19_9GAMM|nr:hypothetical protein D779_0681 [Imhoffiella purpurea]